MPSSEPWDTTSADPFAPVTAPNAEYIAMVTKLFDHWRIWFGAKVSANTRFGTAWVIEWADYLQAQSATVDEMRQAYIISRDLDFPPTNARDFLALVRTSRHIDPVIALSVAVEAAGASMYDGRPNWHTGEIHETAQRIGIWNLLNEPSATLTPKWNKIYSQVCDESVSGKTHALPALPPPKRQARQPKTPPELATETIEKILKMLKSKGATA